MNNVTLTLGFGNSAYNEYWRIWIGMNKDGDFEEAEEGLFSKNGNTAVSGIITISTTATGQTRIRVSMRYNTAPVSYFWFL